jgi:hypothetical protein
MRVRAAYLAVLATALGVAVPAHAGTVTPQIIDPTGDANGLNDQGVFATAPPGFPENTPTSPASLSAADITSVSFVNTFVTKRVHGKKTRVPTGFVVTMTLAAPPTTPGLFYRVAGATHGCDSLYFEYSTAPTDPQPGSARCAAVPPQTNRDIAVKHVAVVGNSIVWTVPVTSIPAGSTITALAAQTRGTAYVATPAISGGPTAPQFDYASTTRVFTVGR